MSIHFSADTDTVDTIYRIILSVNQLSIYGAVAAICEEFVGQPDNTGEPVVLEGQSIVLGKIKAEVPVQDKGLEDAKILMQNYFQQVNSLSPENRLDKFCKEAGFMSVVEVGQYFVTRNVSEFVHAVACHEYTHPRDDPASEAKGWIKGNTRIGPILEVTTSFQQFKYGVEVRIPSVKEDNSQSWVRISFGTVRYVNNYIKYDTQNLESPQEEQDVPASSEVVAARSKAKAKPQPRESTGTTTIPLSERVWIDIEPSKQDLESHTICRRKSSIFFDTIRSYIENKMEQFNSTRLNSMYGIILFRYNWSDSRWIACLAAGGGPKRRYQYCSDYLGSIIYLRALQGHSGDSLVDLAFKRQCINCTWDLSIHLSRRKQFQSSINSQQWIDTWRSRFEQETICVLLAN